MPYIPSSRQYSVVTATRRSRGGSEVRGRYDDFGRFSFELSLLMQCLVYVRFLS